jgi:hypothetical protein
MGSWWLLRYIQSLSDRGLRKSVYPGLFMVICCEVASTPQDSCGFVYSSGCPVCPKAISGTSHRPLWDRRFVSYSYRLRGPCLSPPAITLTPSACVIRLERRHLHSGSESSLRWHNADSGRWKPLVSDIHRQNVHRATSHLKLRTALLDDGGPCERNDSRVRGTSTWGEHEFEPSNRFER